MYPPRPFRASNATSNTKQSGSPEPWFCGMPIRIFRSSAPPKSPKPELVHCTSLIRARRRRRWFIIENPLRVIGSCIWWGMALSIDFYCIDPGLRLRSPRVARGMPSGCTSIATCEFRKKSRMHGAQRVGWLERHSMEVKFKTTSLWPKPQANEAHSGRLT